MTAGSGPWLLPQAFEPMPGNPGVIGRVLGIAVTQVVLHCAQVGALIGQVVAAGMAEHVRPDAPELCGLASDPHDIIDGLAGELCLPLARVRPRPVTSPGRGQRAAGLWWTERARRTPRRFNDAAVLVTISQKGDCRHKPSNRCPATRV